jgi:hypothetical protein
VTTAEAVAALTARVGSLEAKLGAHIDTEDKALEGIERRLEVTQKRLWNLTVGMLFGIASVLAGIVVQVVLSSTA